MLNRVRYSGIYILVTAVLYIGSFYLPEGKSIVPEIEVLDRAKATIDALSEMNKIVVALNSAMFGAAAALAVKGATWSTKWGRLEGILVVIALICGAASYYGIYIGQVAELGMIYAGTINPFEARLSAGLTIEYYGTLLGLFLLGLVFARMLEERSKVAVDK